MTKIIFATIFAVAVSVGLAASQPANAAQANGQAASNSWTASAAEAGGGGH